MSPVCSRGTFEMTVEEILSDDEDGPPRSVSDSESESESEKDSD